MKGEIKLYNISSLTLKVELHFNVSRSFQKYHTITDDIYPKYVQFKTLHKCFLTNEKSYKMVITSGPSVQYVVKISIAKFIGS